MKKSIIFSLLMFACLFALVGCSGSQEDPVNPDTPDTPDTPTVDPEDPFYYPETNLDDGKRRTLVGLRVRSRNVTIYFGETIDKDSIEVYMVYNELENSESRYSAIKITNFNLDDTRVNYYKEGTYRVIITARVRDYVSSTEIQASIKADKYESLGVKHLIGIKCNETINVALNTAKSSIVPENVHAVYTENEYEGGQLVLIEGDRMRSGYTLSLDDVDTSKAGTYIAYLSYSEDYDGVTITVSTFFRVIVK